MDNNYNIKLITETFPIDTKSPQKITIPVLKENTNLYQVIPEKSPLLTTEKYVGTPYILETYAGIQIASHPHIVGDNLKSLCIENAKEFIKAAKYLDYINSHNIGIVQILRGAPGYRLSDVLSGKIPILNIRTKYNQNGYRDHSGDTRCISVIYHDSIQNELKKAETLLFPDTFATGRSAEAVLMYLFRENIFPETILLYGFIAIPALERLGNICKDYGIKLVSFSICDLTQLASNNYDMPVYGLDESLYKTSEKLCKMGSILSLDTLNQFSSSYVPGLDQPGDWSERHIKLYNGRSSENGDILGHISKSIQLIKNLREINSGQKWYTDCLDLFSMNEISNLEATYLKY